MHYVIRNISKYFRLHNPELIFISRKDFQILYNLEVNYAFEKRLPDT